MICLTYLICLSDLWNTFSMSRIVIFCQESRFFFLRSSGMTLINYSNYYIGDSAVCRTSPCKTLATHAHLFSTTYNPQMQRRDNWNTQSPLSHTTYSVAHHFDGEHRLTTPTGMYQPTQSPLGKHDLPAAKRLLQMVQPRHTGACTHPLLLWS